MSAAQRLRQYTLVSVKLTALTDCAGGRKAAYAALYSIGCSADSRRVSEWVGGPRGVYCASRWNVRRMLHVARCIVCCIRIASHLHGTARADGTSFRRPTAHGGTSCRQRQQPQCRSALSATVSYPKDGPSPPGGSDASRRAPRSTPARTSGVCVCVSPGGGPCGYVCF